MVDACTRPRGAPGLTVARTVLVVDDEPTLRETLAEALAEQLRSMLVANLVDGERRVLATTSVASASTGGGRGKCASGSSGRTGLAAESSFAAASDGIHFVAQRALHVIQRNLHFGLDVDTTHGGRCFD